MSDSPMRTLIFLLFVVVRFLPQFVLKWIEIVLVGLTLLEKIMSAMVLSCYIGAMMGKTTILQKNPHYWEERTVFLDKICIYHHPFPQESVRYLQEGKIDALFLSHGIASNPNNRLPFHRLKQSKERLGCAILL